MERYERERSLSIYWMNRANDLRGAAGAVWFVTLNTGTSGQIHNLIETATSYDFPSSSRDVFFMLCGLSLELQYKALIVENGDEPPLVHDLRKMVAKTQLDINNDDLELLDILTDHIVWAGRYPVPRGGRTNWDRLRDRMDASLCDPVPSRSIRILRPNKRLDWDDYSRIWSNGSSCYWKLYCQRHP